MHNTILQRIKRLLNVKMINILPDSPPPGEVIKIYATPFKKMGWGRGEGGSELRPSNEKLALTCSQVRFFISKSIFHLCLRMLPEDVNFRLKVVYESRFTVLL